MVGICRWWTREGRRRRMEKTGRVVTSAVGPIRTTSYSHRKHCLAAMCKIFTFTQTMVVLFKKFTS